MKKNSSCRSIKTGFSPSSAFLPPYQKPTSPLYRKMPTIDISARQHPQKIEVMPSSAKYSAYSAYFNRKKGLSNNKNSEATQVYLNQINHNNANSNTQQGYSTLKTKINDLEGRLLQIKKNFENSFVTKKNKNNDKSYLKSNKQNQPIQGKDRVKAKLAIDVSSRNNIIDIYNKNSPNQISRFQHSKSKTHLSKIQANGKVAEGALICKNSEQTAKNKMGKGSNNTESNIAGVNTNDPINKDFSNKEKGSLLQQYVTTFTCQPRNNTLLQCTSEVNLLKAKQDKDHRKVPSKYYISQVINSFYAVKPSSFDQLCKNHLITSIDILSYIRNSSKQPPETISIRPLPKAHRQTIIFDLDETLIHCNQNTNVPYDVSLPIKFPNNTIITAGINVRPFARECLRELVKYFEIIVFTASHECYANVIVDYLDPEKDIVSHRYFRDSCFRTEEGFYVKDLRVVDRDLKNVLLVDNAAYSYCFQLDNGVPVIPFYDNKADLQLKSLTSYLKQFVGARDMRVRNGKQMKLGDYHNFRDPKSLISKLYEKD